MSENKQGSVLNAANLKKYITRDNLIILVLVGILLFIIALPLKKENTVDEEFPGALLGESGGGKKAADADPTGEGGVLEYGESYAKELERRLEEILMKVEGVGEVKVMVTLKTTEEVVIEKNENIDRSVTKETDKNGGTREISQTQKNVEEVMTQSGSEGVPLIKKTLFPSVEGVIVVAKGCGNGAVDKKITEMIQAVTGLEANRIIAAKMR